MAPKDEAERIEPTFSSEAEVKAVLSGDGPGDADAEEGDDQVLARPDDGRAPLGDGKRRSWGPLAFATAIAVTAVVAAAIGATVSTALHPGAAVGTSGEAAPIAKRLDDLSADLDAMRASLDAEVRRIDDRLSSLDGGKPSPYTPPATPRRVDGERESSAAPAGGGNLPDRAGDPAPETVASIVPPVPRSKPDVPPTEVAQPLGAPPASLGTLPPSGPTVIYAPPRQEEPRRFGALGSNRDVAPRNAPPLPIPGTDRSDEAQSIPGWRVVDVVGGRAIIDGGFLGTFEVEPGMELPEIGMIDSIYPGSDGWVVATSRGIITSNP